METPPPPFESQVLKLLLQFIYFPDMSLHGHAHARYSQLHVHVDTLSLLLNERPQARLIHYPHKPECFGVALAPI